MHYLAYVYAILFVAWCVWELSDLRRSRYPWWLLIIEGIWKVLLCALITLYITRQGAVEQDYSFLRVAVFLIVGFEVMLRVLALRHEELDLDLSESNNRLAVRIALVITGLFLVPAVYITVRFAWPEPSPTPWIWLAVAVTSGFALAYCWPKLPGVFPSSGHREMVKWLESNGPYHRSPDQIELLDNSAQEWPMFEEKIQCQLFRIRYNQEWYVGFVGPATHCFSTPVPEGRSLSEIYQAYMEWFADHASRALIMDAVRDMPDDFRKLVHEAVSDNQPPNTV